MIKDDDPDFANFSSSDCSRYGLRSDGQDAGRGSPELVIQNKDGCEFSISMDILKSERLTYDQ